MSNETNDNAYLIQALLAEFKEDGCEMHNYDEIIIEEEFKAESISDDDTKDLQEVGYDWDNITNVEDEETIVKATHVLPSFTETVSGVERNKELATLFEKEFLVNKSFLDKADVRFQNQKVSRANNVPFETIRSDAKCVKMGCKHFGYYRIGTKTKKVNLHNFVPEFGLKNEVVFSEKVEDTDKSHIKRPSRKTGTMGCTAFINVRMDNKNPGNHWKINKNWK